MAYTRPISPADFLASCGPEFHRAPQAGRASWRLRLRAFTESFRRNGVRAALTRSLYRIAARVFNLQIVHMLSLELDQVNCDSGLQAMLDYRFLTADECGAFASDPRNDLDSTMAERLQSDRDFCFAALEGAQLVNYSWYALEIIESEHSLGHGMSLPTDTVYLYKAYTHPDDRGRGVHRAALARAAPRFAARGVVRLIALVEYGNWASLRSHHNLGCQSVGRIFRLGRPSWGLALYPRRAATLGLRFGD